MRTLNSLKNAISNISNSIVLNLLRFISRIVFVKVLSDVYLGVNGLLSNVLGLLALAELGVGTAISYSLYKPLSLKKQDQILSLMKFYRKAYHIIAIVVLILGLVLLPFLPWFIKDTTGIENLTLIYLIFLGNMVIGYLFSYKRTLITADQKNYKIVPFIMFFNFLTTILQIAILLILKDYVAYLLVQTLCILLENITVNVYINKCYPYLKDIKNAKSVEKNELGEIIVNIKSLMLHRVGNYVLAATDNIVISKFIGIVTVGIYSNYVLIHSAISNFIYMFVSNITASFGNLIAEGNKEKRYKVFKEFNFITFALYGVSALVLLFVFNPFIELVFGTKFVLPFIIVLVIMINYYLVGINQVPIVVQSAAGVYKYDRYVPLVEAFVNLFISVVLVRYIGILGVLIGTLVSYLLPLFIKPFVVFKYVFEKEVCLYFKSFIKQLLVLVLSGIIVWLFTLIHFNSLIMMIIYNFVVSIIVPTLIIIVFYHKTAEFNDALGRLKFILGKIRK